MEIPDGQSISLDLERNRAPIAALCSFLVPGGGQLYNSERRLALLFFVPVLGAAGALWIATSMLDGSLLARLLDRRVIVALLILNGALLAWRLVSMLQAHRHRASFGLRRWETWATAILVMATVAMHLVPVPNAIALVQTVNVISSDAAGAAGSGLRERIPVLAPPSASEVPTATREPEVDGEARTNVLLVGIDSDVGRDHALTDTMLVVSINPTGSSTMVSIPRDLVNAPLPNGELYPEKLNSLLQNASAEPDRFPFGAATDTLKATIARLLGVPIHYFAAVDLAGFKAVIDAVGGVTINVDSPIADISADVFLDAGPVFMDGDLALRYVRSRHGVGNNDFVRAGRQQQLLAAVRDQLGADLFFSLPRLLEALQDTIATDVPAERIPDLALAVQLADFATGQRVVIQPPDYVTPATGPAGAYILLPDLDRIRQLGRDLLSD